jgi:agmatine/peptidylarginine deiminase
LGEDDDESPLQHLDMVVYYSGKSYNPKVLITEMLNAWGIQKLVLAKKVGDYLFKLEFGREEDKRRVLEGGPWRHKGDAFILTHYDGLARPSEIRIAL